jgi:uncharacterized protein
VHYLMIPGIDGSDDSHWQSIWEQRYYPRAIRITPSSWSQPDLADWTHAIGDAVRQTGPDVVLVAHSLGCLAAVHWMAQRDNTIRGAFLVAPPDVAGPHFPARAAGTFLSVRARPLTVPGIVISSVDDPYSSAEAAAQIAHDWQIPQISAGAAGHLNSASSLGAWGFGEALLTAFTAGTARP